LANRMSNLKAPRGPVRGNEPSGYYNLIQAGRGAACLCVVLFHSLIAYSSATLPPMLEYIRVLSRWGWLGVHVFFAISGWCIAERLAKGFRTGESGGHFAIERSLRIYPTYWAALAATILLRIAAVPFNTAPLSVSAPTGWQDWIGSLFLLSPYLGCSPFLFVSWSLVFELGFYLCAVVALVAARRRLAGGTLLFLIGCAMCLIPCATQGRPPIWFVLGLWPNFFAGMAAWWAARRGGRALGYGALAILLAATIAWPAYGGPARLTSVVAAWILALAYRRDGKLSESSTMRFFCWMGGLSYSLYLIHVPMMSPTLNLLGRWIPSTSTWFIAAWVSAVLLAIAGAKCLNRLVEQPIESWRRRAI
jgi:exopolysaccharide production protein ExoZ